MRERIEIAPVSAEEFEQLLPLIAAYQRFYEVEDVDEERNRAFFRRFLAPSDDGLLLGARDGERFLGYACLYWHFSSTLAAETVLMNDLYVEPDTRGRGVGRALIEASADGRPRTRRRPPRMGDRARQPHRPAPLRLDRSRALRMGRVRARAVNGVEAWCWSR